MQSLTSTIMTICQNQKNGKTMQSLQLFNRSKSKQIYARSAQQFAQHNFLHDWAQNDLLSRLTDIKRTFPRALQIGDKCCNNFQNNLIKTAGIETLSTLDLHKFTNENDNFIYGDAENLPIKPQSLDLIISPLHLHTINDLPGALAQMRIALKPDGLLIANMFGGETLHELRASLNYAESIIYNGISPHIAPFADKPQMGDLLSRAGLSLPVVDSDILTVSYPHIFKLMHDLRGMGESNIIADKRKIFTRKNLFMEAQQFYQSHFPEPQDPSRLTASFEIISLIGWAPDSSQQKPLKPGSAQYRLSDALNSKEEKL